MQQSLPFLPSEAKTFPRSERAKQMLWALYIYRFLTARQFEQLFWYPEKLGILAKETRVNTHCQALLLKMRREDFAYQAEILRATQGKLPYVYFFWTEAERYLIEHDGIEKINWNQWRKDISEYSLWHSIQCNDVRIVTELSARRNGFTLDWTDEPTIKHTHVRMVVPDGYFVLTGHGPRHFQFVEVDRRTETGMYKNPDGRDWRRKINQYQSFFNKGIYRKLYNVPGGCRVLTVTTGERRLTNLKLITEHVGGKARFWFTTMKQALTEDVTTAPIWQKAGSDGSFSLV